MDPQIFGRWMILQNLENTQENTKKNTPENIQEKNTRESSLANALVNALETNLGVEIEAVKRIGLASGFLNAFMIGESIA